MEAKYQMDIFTEINNMGVTPLSVIVHIQLDKNLLGLISFVVAEVIVALKVSSVFTEIVETLPRNVGLQRACWASAFLWLFRC